MPPRITGSALYPNLIDDSSAVRPTLHSVAEQLNALDGSFSDQLYIEGTLTGGDDFWVCIDDGTGGHVVLGIRMADETFYLVGDDPADGSEYALIHSGGQQSDTLTRWIISKHVAARGLWFFLATGALDPGLRWEALSEVGFSPP